jgi:hypothetical protein
MRKVAAASKRMPEQMPSMFLEAFANHVMPAAVRFTAGESAGTLTLGTHGDWRISAAGVAPIHAALHFDGQTLYVVGRPDSPIYVDGECAGTDWFKVQAPATLEIGTARIDVYDFDTPSPCELPTQPGGPLATRRGPSKVSESSVVMRRADAFRDCDEERSTDVIPMRLVFAAMDQVEARLQTLRSANDGMDTLITEDDEPETRVRFQQTPRAQREHRTTREINVVPEQPEKVPLWKQFPVVFAVIATCFAVCVVYLSLSQRSNVSVPATLPTSIKAVETPQPEPPPALREPNAVAPEPVAVTASQAPSAEVAHAEAVEPEALIDERERRAVVALWNGDRREALRLYQRLAARHPDSKIYQQAVQSLKRRGR